MSIKDKLVSHLRILYRRFWWLRFLTLLAGFAEADRRPFLDCRAQIPGVAGEEHRHAVMVLGAGRGVAEAEVFELGAVVGIEPARRLKRSAVETGREVVFGGKPRGQHIELQRTDDA